MVDLSVRIGSLVLPNPVMTASGTFGYGTEYSSCLDIDKLGAIITKTVTLKPREGNPMPRIAETPAGMLNSIGLANVGVEAFLRDKLPKLEGLAAAVIVNIAGDSVEDYADVARRVVDHPRVDGLEINVSCPNVKQGGITFGVDSAATASVVSAVRKTTAKPIIAKLTPNVTDITSIAKSAEEAGADAVSLINTVLGMAVDIQTRRPLLARIVGGLSGPAIKPIAVAKVYQTAKAVKIPIIGIGGIMTWQDAVEFLLAGASAVQVGTWNFVDPAGAIAVAEGIRQYCVDNEIKHIADLVGRLKET